jgi:glutathione S-transferase
VPVQWLRFGRGTVPGLVLDREKTVGSRAIMQRLDELRPEPPLYPGDPQRRRAIERADLWGDEVLQALARRMAWWALRRRPSAITTYGEGSSLPLPDFLAVASAPLIVRLEWRINGVGDPRARQDVAELPGHLDRVDAWLGDGTLGSEEQPSGAGLQIWASIALLDTIADLRPLLAGRPCLEAARRQFPGFPGEIPTGTVPADWLPASTPA